jgi:Putative DNA-binding domain
MKLLELQRRMAGAIMAPLGTADRLGRTAATEAEAIIAPNDRLTSAERLEIYAKSYWYRILDSLYDDFPGLRAILGVRAFDKLSRAYLAELPSESFTLRDLGSRLPEWLTRHPEHAGKNPTLALDMVRLEWAHVVAFDGPAEKVLGPEDLLELTPQMTFRVQPYITLLALQYPVEDLRLQVSELAEGHGEASNAVLRHRERRAVRRFSLKREDVYVAVSRASDVVCYRRMDEDEFRLLDSLRGAKPVGEAIDSVFGDSDLPLEELRAKIEEWFRTWAESGWFCHPGGEV